MADVSMTIFTVPPEVARLIHGRYVCLIGEGDKQRWIVGDSLVVLSRDFTASDLDWATIEKALAEKGAWRN
jgi:hypothetical protein